ncbi:putative aldouronate transport system permease protein [Catenulispora sp. GP43]|uniref:ABC transporter permease n=1 Tax=Catenulispora sp. GP43 TaxID=3156263 RepID=UPI003512E691
MTEIRAADRPASRSVSDKAAVGGHPRVRSRRGRRTAGTVARPSLTLWQRIKRDRVMLALMLPGFLYFAVFSYAPLFGYLAAFEDYQPYTGFVHSTWVGLQNFTDLFADQAFWSALSNTFVISLIQLILFFPAPIGLALLLNSVASARIRKFVQSVVYLPHFIGWVVIVSIFQEVLGPTGAMQHMMSAVGLPRFDFMSNPGFFPWLVAVQAIWKDCGWGTIIFLAALMAVDQGLYEAAAVDGAGRWRRFRSVTLPGIMPVVILLLILRLGTILSVGFEQILLQRDTVGAKAGEVLDTYVYYHGVATQQWGTAAAAGLIKAVVGLVLVLGANKLAHRFGQEGIYSRGDR